MDPVSGAAFRHEHGEAREQGATGTGIESQVIEV